MEACNQGSHLRDFLELPYEQLEELNLESKTARLNRVDAGKIEEQRRKYLTDEKRIKAVTVCFSDLEGRLHMLDYDKKFLLSSADNLTFDGSSIRGFTEITESDLRLGIDWSAFYWLPSDIFGPGKVIVFGDVKDQAGKMFAADFRGRLANLTREMYAKDKTVAHVSAEIEGFLFKGRDAERKYYEAGNFEFLSTGGYYHSLPQDPLRQFIDAAAEVQRAMAFLNEKDHPEVGPSQFEMNFSYAEAMVAADQIQLYKLLCRQVAQRMGITASFLPKPVTGVNGSGMHTNMSISRDNKNLFYDQKGQDNLSSLGHQFIARILNIADEICLVLNSSVNSYRRLDPNFEAPNEIKSSAVNRSAMIRVPLGNERSARIEVRSVSPDANPYLLIYTLLQTGLNGPDPAPPDTEKRPRTRILPDNIYAAMRQFKRSTFLTEILGENTHGKFVELKHMAADRCPRALGNRIKRSEIMFHHEVTNQLLWSKF
ncbi:MAG: glutamine synthetase [Phycisphaerales bacterium]|nr:glutamine synthetase [Phycisphaerales bacterium]